MFGEIISIIILALPPIIPELFSVLLISHVPMLHVGRFGGLGLYILIYKSQGRCIVGLDRRWWLPVAHLLQQIPGRYGLARVK